MAYAETVSPSVVVPNSGVFGNNGMDFILGLVFGRGGLGGLSNGTTPVVATAKGI